MRSNEIEGLPKIGKDLETMKIIKTFAAMVVMLIHFS